MYSWLKKQHDNGNKRTGYDVEAAVNTNANRVFARPLGTSALLLFFLLNNYHKYTTLTVRGRGYFRRLKGVASKKVWEDLV